MTSCAFSMHWHDSIEILYFVEGSGYTKCDNQEVRSETGDIIIINTNQLHTVIPETKLVRYHCFILPQDLFHKGDINIYSTQFINRVAKDEDLNRLIDGTIEDLNSNVSGNKLKIKGQLYIIFAHLMQHYRETAPTSDKQAIKVIQMIKSALLFMEHHYDQSITLDDICRHVNLSKYYFSRVFKDTVGRSPMEYLNIIRINHATELLLKGSLNVSEVAERCGFNSINYFSKVFKRYKNISPSSIKDHGSD